MIRTDGMLTKPIDQSLLLMIGYLVIVKRLPEFHR
jgi:hypothetical protein